MDKDSKKCGKENEDLVKLPNGDPAILEINVNDSVSGKDLGPGQKK